MTKQHSNNSAGQSRGRTLSGNHDPEHEKLYHKYYEITQTPVRGVSLSPKQMVIDQVEKNYGYFALISNGVKDPLEALELYRARM